MPLTPGSSQKIVSQNIRELHKGKTFAHTEGKFGKERADKQAVAIALNEARKAKRAAGGLAPFKPPSMNPPFYVRNEARQMSHVGPIMSAVPGRTDRHNMNVPSGSYVLPADHVSSLGQGNTQAGMSILNRMFSSGPYGVSPMRMAHGPGAPRPPRIGSDEGGARGNRFGQPTPIVAAGGEYVIPPHIVARIGDGDLKRGHEILDRWVVSNRKRHVKTLKKLPGPAKR